MGRSFTTAIAYVSDRNLEGVVPECTNILPTNDADGRDSGFQWRSGIRRARSLFWAEPGRQFLPVRTGSLSFRTFCIHMDLAVRSNLATAEERATSQSEPPQ